MSKEYFIGVRTVHEPTGHKSLLVNIGDKVISGIIRQNEGEKVDSTFRFVCPSSVSKCKKNLFLSLGFLHGYLPASITNCKTLFSFP
jgi:hypothetical protein